MDHAEENYFKFKFGIFLTTVIVIFGLIGNSFGLASITYAKANKKYHLDKHWRTSTLFFFHLLIVDLVYCLFLFAKEIHGLFIYLEIDDDLVNEKECKFFVLSIQTFATIGGWSMMSIVFTQAIPRIW